MEERGFIISPRYPSYYPTGRECFYVISPPDATFLSIKIIDMDIDCTGTDNIELRDGHSSKSPIIGVFCGANNSMPSSIDTTQSSLWLKFSSSHQGIGRGFNISYESINGTSWSYNGGACGGVMDSPSGIITSPSFPDYYPPAQDCIYVISVPSAPYINLTFTTMDVSCPPSGIASPSSYKYDFIEFRDGSEYDSPLIGKFCGNVSTVPKYIQSTQKYLRIRCSVTQAN